MCGSLLFLKKWPLFGIYAGHTQLAKNLSLCLLEQARKVTKVGFESPPPPFGGKKKKKSSSVFWYGIFHLVIWVIQNDFGASTWEFIDTKDFIIFFKTIDLCGSQ